MEKGNSIYPDMPAMPNAPPSYNQSCPREAMPGMMPSSIPEPMHIPPQQEQSFVQAQPTAVQNYLPPIPPLGPQPCLVTCPSCHQHQMSNVRPESSTKTHLFAALLCAVGLCCCACIPYCVDSCKNANHYCSNCDAYLGMYNK